MLPPPQVFSKMQQTPKLEAQEPLLLPLYKYKSRLNLRHLRKAVLVQVKIIVPFRTTLR